MGIMTASNNGFMFIHKVFGLLETFFVTNMDVTDQELLIARNRPLIVAQ